MQVAAHELRHDAQVARQLLDELTKALRNDVADGRRQLTQQLRRALERLERDIDQLLIGHGGDLDTIRRTPTNIAQLVLRVVHAHPTGRQPIDVDVAPVVVNVDALKVERILDNLLANALHHTPDDCPVRVRAAVEPPGITVIVEDEGPGLSPAEQETLLAHSDDPPVGGMGLWIVVRFARLHGGDVRVEQPESGRGARFVVWLPVQNLD